MDLEGQTAYGETDGRRENLDSPVFLPSNIEPNEVSSRSSLASDRSVSGTTKRRRSTSRRFSFSIPPAESPRSQPPSLPRLSADSGVGDLEEVVDYRVESETRSYPVSSLVEDREGSDSPREKGFLEVEHLNRTIEAPFVVDGDSISELTNLSEVSRRADARPPSAADSGTSIGAPFCRICLDSDGETLLIAPCLCRGSGALCHAACLQTWLRSKEKSATNRADVFRCGVCKGRYRVKIDFEKEGKRTSNKKDLFKMILWLSSLCFVVLSPLLIFRSCVDYLLSRSPYILFVVILNCLGFVVYLYFTIYAIHAWILPAAERWFQSNLRLVVRPDSRSADDAAGNNGDVV